MFFLFKIDSAAKSVEQKVSLLNGIGRCSQLNQSGDDFNKLAAEIIQKTAKADKESKFRLHGTYCIYSFSK